MYLFWVNNISMNIIYHVLQTHIYVLGLGKNVEQKILSLFCKKYRIPKIKAMDLW